MRITFRGDAGERPLLSQLTRELSASMSTSCAGTDRCDRRAALRLAGRRRSRAGAETAAARARFLNATRPQAEVLGHVA